jgi:DNA repair protein RadD
MELILREYQRHAVEALWKHVRTREDNPCIVLPTGAGKGVVLAQMAKDVVGWEGRMAIVAHVKELLEQTAGNIMKMAPEIGVGIYSAGLGARELGYPITVAGIQSIYNKADALGHVDIIAIDEAHRIPPDGEGMYRTFLEAVKKINPNVRLVGLTATPYRLQSGVICLPENLLNAVCYEIGVKQLIVAGYLSPLKSKTAIEQTDVSKVSIRGGEFVAGELQAAMTADVDQVILACSEIVGKTEDRKSVLVFASGIEHAQQIAQFINDVEGVEVRTIFGDKSLTSNEERARTIRDFRERRLKYLVNVDVLTTGFDAPGVDCVAILRPTMSPGLFYQMVGRGFRLAEGKKDCLILDFGGNLMRHGPIDRIRAPRRGAAAKVDEPDYKECPACREVVSNSCEICPDCGMKFEKKERAPREVKHDGKAADKDVLSGPEQVFTIEYSKHEKKDNPEGKPPTLRVDYHIGAMWPVSEFICLQHQGFARNKAEAWWKVRSPLPPPATIDEAIDLIQTKGINEPKKIVLEYEGKFPRVARIMELTFRGPALPVKEGQW